MPCGDSRHVHMFMVQTLLSTVERDLAMLQEVSGHHKKRSAEILSMLLRDLCEIGTVIGTTDLKTVRTSDITDTHLHKFLIGVPFYFDTIKDLQLFTIRSTE